MSNQSLKIKDGIGNFLSSIRSDINEGIAKLKEDFDSIDSYDSYLVQVAGGLDPEPLGIAQVVKRSPYTNPAEIKSGFYNAVERGWLRLEGEGAYRTTEKGRNYLEKIGTVIQEIVQANQLLSDEKLERLNNQLEKIVEQALKVEAVSDLHALNMSIAFAREDDPLMLQVRRNMINIMAFRDDTHVAAWTLHEIEGYVFEVLSFLKNKQASTAAELTEKLEYREYSEKEYQKALDKLFKDALIFKLRKGDYAISPLGKTTWLKVEDQTNKNFDAAFAGFSNEELEEIEDLLNQMVKDDEPVAAVN